MDNCISVISLVIDVEEEKMSDWVKDTLQQRLEFLRTQVEILPEITILQNKLDELEHSIQRKLGRSGRSLHKEWVQVQNEIASMQMGWIYAKGVQDGLKMLIFLNKSEEELAMSNSQLPMN